jgi:hypothetical protein
MTDNTNPVDNAAPPALTLGQATGSAVPANVVAMEKIISALEGDQTALHDDEQASALFDGKSHPVIEMRQMRDLVATLDTTPEDTISVTKKRELAFHTDDLVNAAPDDPKSPENDDMHSGPLADIVTLNDLNRNLFGIYNVLADIKILLIGLAIIMGGGLILSAFK